MCVTVRAELRAVCARSLRGHSGVMERDLEREGSVQAESIAIRLSERVYARAECSLRGPRLLRGPRVLRDRE